MSRPGERVLAILRAVSRDGELTLVPWNPGLPQEVPEAVRRELGDEGIAIADLHVLVYDEEAREISVDFCFDPPAEVRGSAEAVIREWAGAAGYTRVWLPDGVIDLDPVAAPQAVRSACRVCGQERMLEDPRWWANVRTYGRFPDYCSLCGSRLPQWVGAADRASEPEENLR